MTLLHRSDGTVFISIRFPL